MPKVCVFIIVILFLASCNKKGVIYNKDLVKYEIEFNSDFFQWNDLVDGVVPIQLETVDDALIAYFTQGDIYENDIYLFDMKLGKVVVFNMSGEYIGRVGARGNGVGEYVELRDYCVTGDHIYILDYKKILCYDRETREFIESWSIDDSGSFNPSNFLVYNKDHYFLWCSNPDTWNRDKHEYYRLREIKEGSIEKEYFKYEYRTSGDPRFYSAKDYHYLKPIDGEDIIYKLKKDSLLASFAIDFGKYSITSERIDELRKSKERNAYFKSNTYKSISNILETEDYIYFKCVGPETKTYEGLINKETKQVKFGLWDFNKSPRFFFSDGVFLYGYYEPHTLIENKSNGKELNTCFEPAFNLKSIDISDNIIIIKVLLR